MNANFILARVKAEEKYKKNAGFFLMDCYTSPHTDSIIAVGNNHWYHYYSLKELDTPIWKCPKNYGPQPQTYLGAFYCKKAPLHTQREVLDFFGVNTRHAIGAHFNIRELQYVRKGFLEYLKRAKEFGIIVSNLYGFEKASLDSIKWAYDRKYNYFQLLGYHNVPKWVEHNAESLSKYRRAKALKAALIKCKADWTWQRKSIKYWYDTNFAEEKKALSTIREVNISFNHAYLIGGGNLQEYETSSRRKIFSWYGKLSLKPRKVLRINGENVNVATIDCDIWDGKDSTITKYVVWGQDFTHHFEGSSLKEAVKFYLDRHLTKEEVILRDGVSFNDVLNYGYCLAGTKAFLRRKSNFLHSLISEYTTWDEIPNEIMNLRFYPTPEFAHQIMQRQ